MTSSRGEGRSWHMCPPQPFSGMASLSGQTRPSATALHSFLFCDAFGRGPMQAKNKALILLVEDDRDDEMFTMRALKQNHIHNEIIVVRDGVEALDFLLGTGQFAGRDTTVQPQVTLLDLKLPKLDGLDVLRKIRADERTRLLPVVILTSSNEEQERIRGYTI